MGLLNDMKGAEAPAKGKVVEAADKSEKRAKAKERKAQKTEALARILDYLAKNPVPELKADVELLSKKAERTGNFGQSLLVTIFGSETPAKGTKISALEVFTKHHKGYPEMRKLMKKAEEKGVHIKLNEATSEYEVV